MRNVGKHTRSWLLNARRFIQHQQGLLPIMRDALRCRSPRSLAIPQRTYQHWISLYDTLKDTDRDMIRDLIVTMKSPPVISVIMLVYNTQERFINQAINSLRLQIYPHWELIIVGTSELSLPVLTTIADLKDARISRMPHETFDDFSAAIDNALLLATGDWIALMDHQDTLPAHTLFEVAAEIVAHPDGMVIYTDEDRIDERNVRSKPYFKPDYDTDLLLGQNFVCHLGVYRRDLLQNLGKLNTEFRDSQDHDLALRVTGAVRPDQVRHIAAILYHARQVVEPPSFSEAANTRCISASQKAVSEHLARQALNAELVQAPLMKQYTRILWSLPKPAPLVSIIVPTRDQVELLGQCLDGVLKRTDYPEIEVLIADNGSVEPAMQSLFAQLAEDRRVRILSMPGPFNYASLNNRAAADAQGEVLLLLNNDTDVIDAGWLRELVSHAVRPDVGAVGAKLIYHNRTVQHGGVVLGIGGVAGHFMKHVPQEDPGPFSLLALTRTVSAVTAACLAVRHNIFNEVGGFEAKNLAIAFNDVDFCLRVRARGYRNVWTPFAELYHFESVSRGSDLYGDKAERLNSEAAFMHQNWGNALLHDPYWNPNLSLAYDYHSLAHPPRRERSWQTLKRTNYM